MSAVRVKPLEWAEGKITYPSANAIAGRYQIGFAAGTYVVMNADHIVLLSDLPTLEAAKAAAQSDYEARIMSALLPAQTEPDAGRVEEAAPQADLVTESEVYAALGGWQKAIIDAPQEGVEERRRRCMRAALKAARACSSAQSRQNTSPSPPREEIEQQRVVAGGVKG